MSINKLFAASLTALALLLSACSSVNKQTTAVTITSASLPNATIGVAYTQTLAASGGRAPYTWSLANGTTLPPGLTLASSTGVISGTATTFGVTAIAIQVADSSTPALTATQTFSMTVARVPLAITPVTLAVGTVGVSYTQTLSATGGLAPYTWSVSSGTLPPGLTLAASTGILSGTPTAAQTTTFTVKVTDAASSTATLALNFTAQAAPVPLSVTTTMLPSGPLGSAYTQTLAAAGGTPPYTWQVTTGKLPNGLSIVDSTGVISGTPTVAGTFNFTVQVTDYDAATATASLSITTQAVPLTGNALLQGQYFFKLDSFADDMSGQGHVFHEALVGSLVLDGAGNVSSGLSDRADDYFDNGTQPVTGTYVVNSDGRGTVTLNFGTSRTKVLALAAKAMVADPIGSVARRATLVETDTATDSEEGGKPYSTGFLQLEDPTAFADASLVGNRVFGISGDTFLYNTDINLPQQGGLSAAGLLSVGNDLTLGVASTMDIATNQAFDPNVALTGFLAEDTTPAGVGSGTSFHTFGRALLNFTAPGFPLGTTVTYPHGILPAESIIYIIDANTSYIISCPDSANSANQDEPLYSGYLVKQSGTFDVSSLSGSSIGYGTSQAVGASANYSGASGSQSLYGSSDALISLYTFDGTGAAASFITDENAAGSITNAAASPSLTYVVSATGRALLSGSNLPVFWLSGPNTGFATTNPASGTSGAWPMLITLEPQAAGTYSVASMHGSYLTGVQQPSSYKSTFESGFLLASGTGNLTGTLDMFSDAGGFQEFGANPITVSVQADAAVSSSGRGSVATFLSEGMNLVGSDLQVFYMVSPTRVIFLDTRAGALAPAIVVLQQ